MKCRPSRAAGPATSSPSAALSNALPDNRFSSVVCFTTKPTETAAYTCNKIFDALGTVGPAPFTVVQPKLADPAFLGRKIAIYAAFGVREVHVVNARTLVTRVHRKLGAYGYSETADIPYTQRVTPALAPELAYCLADFGPAPATDGD